MPLVRHDVHDAGVHTITLTDPERRNAMGEAMGAELRAATAAIAADADARVLVVTGDGGSFCAGADLPALFGDTAEIGVAATRERLAAYYRAFLDIRDLAIPTIAAIDGPAVGAGLNLAMACDVRLVGRDASLGATFTKIGLHPGGGCTAFLVEAMGPSRALSTLLLGEALDAEASVAAGLAEGPLGDPLAAAMERASAFARVDPALARDVKASVRLAASGAGFEAVAAFETWAQASSASSERLREWVARFRR